MRLPYYVPYIYLRSSSFISPSRLAYLLPSVIHIKCVLPVSFTADMLRLTPEWNMSITDWRTGCSSVLRFDFAGENRSVSLPPIISSSSSSPSLSSPFSSLFSLRSASQGREIRGHGNWLLCRLANKMLFQIGKRVSENNHAHLFKQKQ